MQISVTRYPGWNPQIFPSASAFLRWLLTVHQTFNSLGLTQMYLPKPEDGGRDYLTRYGVTITPEEYAYAYRVLMRYRSYVNYVEDIDPEWVNTARYDFGDAVEVVQQSKKYPGKTRRVPEWYADRYFSNAE